MNYLDHPDAPQFLSADVLKAADIDMPTFKNWVSRKPSPILLSDSDRSSITGIEGPSYERVAGEESRVHLFTYRRLMQFALTAVLTRLAIPVRKAGMAAAAFTDKGQTVSGWGDGGFPIDRLACQFYREGKTLLVISTDHEFGKVINLKPNDPADSIFERRGLGVVAINVNEVDRRVKAALGLPPDWGRAWQYLPAGATIKIPE